MPSERWLQVERLQNLALEQQADSWAAFSARHFRRVDLGGPAAGALENLITRNAVGV